jgi:hypothetical protein
MAIDAIQASLALSWNKLEKCRQAECVYLSIGRKILLEEQGGVLL